jgi:hypothetical protein
MSDTFLEETAKQGYMYEAGDRQGIFTEDGIVVLHDGVFVLEPWERFSRGQRVRHADYVPVFAPSFVASEVLSHVGKKGTVAQLMGWYKPKLISNFAVRFALCWLGSMAAIAGAVGLIAAAHAYDVSNRRE